MKLRYLDNTPDAYEPPCFEPAQDGPLSHFTQQPFSMQALAASLGKLLPLETKG